MLRKGDVVGFARSEDGALLGVSGEDRRPLPEAQYEWRVMGTKPSLVSGATSKDAEDVFEGTVTVGATVLAWFKGWCRDPLLRLP
jgi:hypothetical protein